MSKWSKRPKPVSPQRGEIPEYAGPLLKHFGGDDSFDGPFWKAIFALKPGQAMTLYRGQLVTFHPANKIQKA